MLKKRQFCERHAESRPRNGYFHPSRDSRTCSSSSAINDAKLRMLILTSKSCERKRSTIKGCKQETNVFFALFAVHPQISSFFSAQSSAPLMHHFSLAAFWSRGDSQTDKWEKYEFSSPREPCTPTLRAFCTCCFITFGRSVRSQLRRDCETVSPVSKCGNIRG